MRLTRLELSGFKSFAGTMELPFEAGVTAIVGPNGCGKSNISDAVRWVLGEQSPRLLRGGKMEDVIFQGSTGRRPVNVAEVSLVFDNADGALPLAYQEVVVTRRLSRSGQSDYLLNRSPVRLRDVQDLLRGTGLGADAAVVMEAKMIDALLSEKAEERRSLFEEAAGIGLFRDRQRSTERRLEETAADLARLEDLISEIQTQVRSLARQRGKAERYTKMIDQRFGIAMTLVRRELEDLDLSLGALGVRARELAAAVPVARERLAEAERARDGAVQGRHTAEARRTEVERQLAEARLEVGRLEGDLALASERLNHVAERRAKAAADRAQSEVRAAQGERERQSAEAECTDAGRALGAVQGELDQRVGLEQSVRERLTQLRTTVRALEEELQRAAEAVRMREGERQALERERAELKEQLGAAVAERGRREAAAIGEQARASGATQHAAAQAREGARAAEQLEQARRQVAELREREARARAVRRQAEDAAAQTAARHDALGELDRQRVGLAPAAQTLLEARDRFGNAVLGPLSDFVRTNRRDAALAERLLGDWLHAVLVRDEAAVTAIRTWHEDARPGPLVLLPCLPGPRQAADGHPLADALRVDGPAAAWVHALLAGHEVLEDGKMLRRANGAVFLDGGVAAGPLQRRAELEELAREAEASEKARAQAVQRLDEITRDLAAAEQAFAAASTVAEQARHGELEAAAARDDADRAAKHAERAANEAVGQVQRLSHRLGEVESRLGVLHADLQEQDIARLRTDERLGADRAGLAEVEGEQEAAREQRVRWQVEAAQVDARLAAARARADRAAGDATEARDQAAALVGEITVLDQETATLTARRAQWDDLMKDRRVAVGALEGAANEAGAQVLLAESSLAKSEEVLEQARGALQTLGDAEHHLELDRSGIAGRKDALVQRVEAEWRKPLDRLLAQAADVAGDAEWLERENARLREEIEAVGPVNALAVDERKSSSGSSF